MLATYMRRTRNNKLEIGLRALLVARKNPALNCNTTSAFGYDLEKKTYWESIKAPVEL